MRYFFSTLVVWVFALSLTGQTWADTDINGIRGNRHPAPKVARGLVADTEALRSALLAAPHEANSTAEASPTTLLLPAPDGHTASFRIVAYDAVGDPGRYPGIRTWYGLNTNDPDQTIFLDWTEQGFHASVRGGHGPSWYIDPVVAGNLTHYQAYFRKDLTDNTAAFDCSTKSEASPGLTESQGADKSAGDCVLRQYRVAITATPQYSNYHGAFTGIQSGLVQSAIVTTVNRINQVFTRDLSIRLQLMVDNDVLYFYDETTSPFSSNLVADLVNENITVQEDRVPLSGFDLGHVYTRGINNGRAFPRASCVDALKSGGATSRVAPAGDPFTIDYVAHEMGHQFGASHTQNNLCNYSSTSGMEPGSGTTIMGYAGICFPNVQLNSDDYFHGRSVQEITDFTENPFTGGSCAVEINNSLFNPQVGSVPDRTIPQGTPFKLTGQASGSGSISYSWEQYDPELGLMPPRGDNQEGPLFRSFRPTAEPYRYFPKLAAVVSGTEPEWETLPLVNRDLNFRLTVNHAGAAYGCAGEEDVRLRVAGDFGPFEVTDPADTNQWSTGQIAQVQWDVAGTDAPAFASPRVDILLSTDNGRTFEPVLLNQPNNGLAEIVVPLMTTDSARILVRSAGNYFYNLSPQNFRITDSVGPASIAMAPVSPAAIGDCFSVTDKVNFDFLLTGSGGATESLEMSVTGLPEELTTVFFPLNPRPGGRVRLTVSGMSGQTLGVYEALVSGVSAEGEVSQPISITKYSGDPEPGPGLIGPFGVQPDIRPVLRVQATVTELYQFQVSERADFSELLYDKTTDQPNFTLPAYLASNSRYFWRARTRDANGGCGISRWSTADFIAGDCPIFSTTGAPVEISTGPPVQSAQMTLDIARSGEIIDLDLVLVNIEHSYLNDVEVDLISPAGTTVPIFNRSCGGNDNLLLTFDDEANLADLFCPPVDATAFVNPPSTRLGAFDAQQLAGTWTLSVRDRANQDGGRINGFSIKACLEQEALPVTWMSFTATGRKTDILLRWSTATEETNDGFYLQRAPAAEPTSWRDLGFVAAGDPDYSFIDATALPNTDYFFRLRQTDLNGQVSYSDIRSARIGAAATDGLHLFPNPTTSHLRYRWTMPGGSRTIPRPYTLTDSRGRKLRDGELLSSGGSLSLEDLPAGIYFLRVTGLDILRVVRL